jgi:hypothetical protein
MPKSEKDRNDIQDYNDYDYDSLDPDEDRPKELNFN